MNPNDPSNMSEDQIRRTNGELVNRLAYSGEYHRRKAARAGAARKTYRDSGCQYLMTFDEFKQQGRRNRILKDYSRAPIFLAGEGKPNSVH